MIRLACVAAFAFCLALTGLPAAAQGTGLVFLEPDRYRSIPLAPPIGLTSIPAEVDLSKDFPTPGDQGAQGSCVGWAVGYALKSYQERRERLWTNWDDTRRMSPSFVYNQIKVGDCNDGARIADALDLVTSTGSAAWVDQPYSENSCNDLPTTLAKQNASVNRVAAWFRINPQDRQAIKTSISAGIPVVVGMTVDDRFKALQAGETWRGGGFPSEGHAMVVVGYSESRDAVKVINSWGTDWGDAGFGWIDFETFRAVTREAYVAQDIVLPIGMVERKEHPYTAKNVPFGEVFFGLQLGMTREQALTSKTREIKWWSETVGKEEKVFGRMNVDENNVLIALFRFDVKHNYLDEVQILFGPSRIPRFAEFQATLEEVKIRINGSPATIKGGYRGVDSSYPISVCSQLLEAAPVDNRTRVMAAISTLLPQSLLPKSTGQLTASNSGSCHEDYVSDSEFLITHRVGSVSAEYAWGFIYDCVRKNKSCLEQYNKKPRTSGQYSLEFDDATTFVTIETDLNLVVRVGLEGSAGERCAGDAADGYFYNPQLSKGDKGFKLKSCVFRTTDYYTVADGLTYIIEAKRNKPKLFE